MLIWISLTLLIKMSRTDNLTILNVPIHGHRYFSTYLGLIYLDLQFSSVEFSCSVVSNSLRPHESQHARPPCPSPTPRVHSDSCPSSQWCHPAISSSVVPFSSHNPSQHQSLFQWVNSSHEVAILLLWKFTAYTMFSESHIKLKFMGKQLRSLRIKVDEQSLNMEMPFLRFWRTNSTINYSSA